MPREAGHDGTLQFWQNSDNYDLPNTNECARIVCVLLSFAPLRLCVKPAFLK